MARVKIDIPESFVFRTEIPVRITDINYGGHLSNDKILAFVHEARIQFLESFKLSEKDCKGVGLIMADAAIQYKSQGFYGDSFLVYVAATDFSQRGFDLVYVIVNQATDKEIARVKTGMVCFDYEKNEIASLPDGIREELVKGKEVEMDFKKLSEKFK